ncbi:MAG: permease-like cell division protein FtsX [Bacillota bacterium]
MSETGKSIWRNKMSSFLSSATTALALFLLGVTFLINMNLTHMFGVVEEQMEIQAYLKNDASEDAIGAAFSQVKDLPHVVEARLVTKEEALLEFKEMFKDSPQVIEGLGEDNPLPASIRVKTEGADLIKGVAEHIKSIEVVDDVIFQEEAAERLASLGRVSRAVSLGGMLVVGLVAVMVIGNSIKLSIDARRHEIAIMKLVGATDEFIAGPFLLTGMVLGTIGALAGAAIAMGLYVWLSSTIETVLPFMPLLNLGSTTAVRMLGVMIGTGVLVGVLGSSISLRRYLRV